MGKKRNGVNNKLKGPAKWQKGSRAARKLQQSRRDAKKAKAAKAEAVLSESASVGLAATLGKDGHSRALAPSERVALSAAKQSAASAQTKVRACEPERLQAGDLNPTGAASGDSSTTRSAVLPSLASAVEVQLASGAGWKQLQTWMLPRLQRCSDVDATVIAQYICDLLRAKPVEKWAEVLPRELATFTRSEVEAHELAMETICAVCDGSATGSAIPSSKTSGALASKKIAKKTRKNVDKEKKPKKKLKQAGWVATTDSASGETYYYHSATRETTWARPPAWSP